MGSVYQKGLRLSDAKSGIQALAFARQTQTVMTALLGALRQLGISKFISSARAYVQASNIFTITKYTGSDPEVSINGNSIN
ncbi:MAG: hypothetical protein EOO77_05425, partial [Oxalobacteraceae bacterium]